MAKRISGLDPQATADNSWVFEVDEPSGATQETQKATGDEVRQIIGALPDNSKVDLTLTTNVAATPTNVSAKYLKVGQSTTLVLKFDLDFSGTDPQISMGTVIDANTILGQNLHCYVSGGEAGVYGCRLTSNTPATATIYGTFSSGGTRTITISGVLI